MTERTLSPDGKWLWNGAEWIPAPPQTEQHAPNSAEQYHESIVSDEFLKLDRFINISNQFFRRIPFHSRKWLKVFSIHMILLLFVVVTIVILGDYPQWFRLIFDILLFTGWPHFFLAIIGNYVSKVRAKKRMNITMKLKQELDFTIHSYKLLASMSQNNNDYRMMQKLQSYNVEIQRAADHHRMGNIFASIVVGTAIGAATHSIVNRK